MTAATNLIQHSFELAAERCEDLTPLVYRRLFHKHPEAEPMFRRETDNLGFDDLLAAAKLLDQAHTYIGHQLDADRKGRKQAEQAVK